MVLPVPTLDHVVVNVRDRIEEGAQVYRRLGFTLTPRGFHTLGSINHLAMFGTEYLELIAAPAGESRRQEILSAPEGLNGLVFGS
ncbi:MAG: VOC family protein, partial [Acetobacteraceae bacterium]|nr:VOC family protein [Acetobacteraceae bacterium]